MAMIRPIASLVVRLFGATPFAPALHAASDRRSRAIVSGIRASVDIETARNVVSSIAVDETRSKTYPVTRFGRALDELSYFIQGFEVSPFCANRTNSI